jgi:hypothetical protein
VIGSGIVFAWAGLLLVTSAGNESQISKARSMFSNVFIGIAITLSAWLIIDTLMKAPGLVNKNEIGEGTKYGPWNEIKCVAQLPPAVKGTASIPGVGTGPAPTPAQTSGPVPPPDNTQTGIAAATNAYIGASTAAGPDGGNKACAWAVNNILKNAGIAPIDGDSVPRMEAALLSGRGSLIEQSSAVPGDIVIQAQTSHVGICLNVGCTQVISNASGNATFTWRSGTDFAPSYKAGPGRIYRVN